MIPMDPAYLTPQDRANLSRCRLVCRAWVPRCRLYLADDLFVETHASLLSLAAFLRSSPFHAGRVWRLKIHGGGPDPSWISTVPLHLPKLPQLRILALSSVTLASQHIRFHQFFSLLRPSQGTEIFFRLSIEKSLLESSATQVATLAAALRITLLALSDTSEGGYPVKTPSDTALVNTWPRSLTSRLWFNTRGSIRQILDVLSPWRRPVKLLRITIHSSQFENTGEFSQDMRSLLNEIPRVFTLPSSSSSHPRQDAVIILEQDMNELWIGPYLSTIAEILAL